MIESQAFYRVLDQSEESDVTDLFSHWSDQLALTVQRSSVRATEGLQTEYNQQTHIQTIIIADNHQHSRQLSSQQTIIISDTHHLTDNHHSRQSSQQKIIQQTIIKQTIIIIADNDHSRQLCCRQSSWQTIIKQTIIIARIIQQTTSRLNHENRISYFYSTTKHERQHSQFTMQFGPA